MPRPRPPQSRPCPYARPGVAAVLGLALVLTPLTAATAARADDDPTAQPTASAPVQVEAATRTCGCPRGRHSRRPRCWTSSPSRTRRPRRTPPPTTARSGTRSPTPPSPTPSSPRSFSARTAPGCRRGHRPDQGHRGRHQTPRMSPSRSASSASRTTSGRTSTARCCPRSGPTPCTRSWRRSSARCGGSGHSFQVRGYSEDYPIADNSTEAGRKQNRRVEITFRPS